jgi:hypothetical protein
MTSPRSERRTSLMLGLLLIVAGAGFLGAQALGISIGAIGWPLYVIVPGVGLLVAAIAVGGPAAVGLWIGGSITTITGLILAVQAATDLWATWAYAWALIAPGGVGVGLLLAGLTGGRPELVAGGARTLATGLVLFGGMAFFFEGLIGLSGQAIAGFDTLLAIVLVGLGIVVVGYGILRPRRDRP